ncbi:unnamed protein product [Caenorhabditis bovis]|uniref:Uncharacterized protein n=1 Tax=Caenorhabditis bovis TaxID=2654633 RepID=A0A8S1F896_9PELO|nr:unnamed protein product [Caenorhabditis bovis]
MTMSTQQAIDDEWRRRLSEAIRREDAAEYSEDSDEEDFVPHPLCRAAPMMSPLARGGFPLTPSPTPSTSAASSILTKKRRSSSSPEEQGRRREKMPHLVQPLNYRRQPMTTSLTTDEASTSNGSPLDIVKSIVKRSASESQDINLSADLFWLKSQISDNWALKWFWQAKTKKMKLLFSRFLSFSYYPALFTGRARLVIF